MRISKAMKVSTGVALVISVLSCSVFAQQNSSQDEVSAVAKIIGGTPAEQNALPWQALIYIDYGRDGQDIFQCGGVIIDAMTVLTAAHCMEQNQVVAMPFEILVWGGITATSSARQSNAYTVASVTIHPDFDADTFANDIALLRLNSALTGDVQPIQIATISEQFEADLTFDNTYTQGGVNPENLLVSGWGLTSTEPDAIVSDTLQQVLLSGVPDEVCDRVWSNINLGNRDQVICAISPSPAVERDSCQGDSGGPLVWQNPQNEGDPDFGLRLVGLVSFGAQCASDVPAVYTEVSHYRTWIGSVAGVGLDFDPDPVYITDPFERANMNPESSFQDAETPVQSGLSRSDSGGGSLAPGGLLGLLSLLYWRRKK
ncbi:serine protease [Photobacterium sp. GJ3]|uniref:S1 family peptidase n=1 Tax=Photobacterium sp. GJ3 TaxID=2829502 RepID=UPI001B8BD4D0|nr:serine protease [Photobacterium sp. GJ3]QUJ68115.1 serine protease [Photobacterium sp. GJ3]